MSAKPDTTNGSPVLVVGPDELLAQVVRYLLPAPAPSVQRVDHLEQALPAGADGQAGEGGHTGAARPAGKNGEGGQPAPRLVVFDRPVDESDAGAINGLRASAGVVPVLMLASDDSRPPRLEPPAAVLPRNADLAALRQALLGALAETSPRPALVWRVASLLIGLVAVAAGLVLVLPTMGVPYVPNLLKMTIARPPAVEQPPATSVRLIADKPDLFELEKATEERMRIRSEEVGKDPARRQLTLSGSLAFDPDLLGRVQSRLQGEVMQIGTSKEPAHDSAGRTIKDAPLTYGNAVEKGQLMAVVWSKDLGTAKSDLVDALVKLHLDEENLAKLEMLYRKGNTSEAVYRQAKNMVSTDLNAVAKARRVLGILRVEKGEIEAVEKEADRIINSKTRVELDKMKDTLEKWARVEVRAPFAGIIVEKNLAVGHMVDPTQDLFKVADMTKLAVFANAYEEDQRILQDRQLQLRPAPVPWKVHLTSDPDQKQLPSEGIERIGYIVDPQQRTNLVIGKVNNRDGRLRVGQSVTALVPLPAPPGVVSIPASALVEDGADSVVFVKPDPKRKDLYLMKRVVVVQRFTGENGNGRGGREEKNNQAYILQSPSAEQRKQGLRGLQPGERVVTEGAVELKAALEEVQARARREAEASSEN
jgi:cobalt-zinc-cadmium efflux system membrane fusion protein